MKRYLVRTAILGLITIGLVSCQSVELAENDSEVFASSPYSKQSVPAKLYAVNDSLLSNDFRLAAASLQGLMTKTDTGIFRMTNDPSRKWLELLKSDYDIEVDSSLEEDFAGILAVFASRLDGYILCNTYDKDSDYESDESLSVALTLAGPLNSIVVTGDTRSTAEEAGLSLTFDAREKKLIDVLGEYESSLNDRQFIFRSFARAGSFLTDYAVAGNMIHYYGSLNNETSDEIFRNLKPNSLLLGWGESEDGLVNDASRESVMVHPADWANNLSILSNVPAETVQKKNKSNEPREENVHTVCFVMSDGDNIQWSVNDYATSEKWFNSPYRGDFKLGWTISPGLVDLAPTVMNYFYSEAAGSTEGRDYFIAGPSGLGYSFPDRYPHIDSATMLLNDYMKKADLHIVNILAKSRWNHDYLENYLSRDNIDAVFLYYYHNYSGGKGSIRWVNDKPVITGRANFWDGFHTPESLAEKLNSMPTDPTTDRGYSLIPVHVWSRSVEDVAQCISLLDEDVQVVAPDEFVDMISRHVRR